MKLAIILLGAGGHVFSQSACGLARLCADLTCEILGPFCLDIEKDGFHDAILLSARLPTADYFLILDRKVVGLTAARIDAWAAAEKDVISAIVPLPSSNQSQVLFQAFFDGKFSPIDLPLMDRIGALSVPEMELGSGKNGLFKASACNTSILFMPRRVIEIIARNPAACGPSIVQNKRLGLVQTFSRFCKSKGLEMFIDVSCELGLIGSTHFNPDLLKSLKYIHGLELDFREPSSPAVSQDDPSSGPK